MPTNLVNSTERFFLTGAMGDHFTTFARSITIHKEPIKTFTDINNNNILPGYENTSAVTNMTLTPVTGQYMAIVNYNRNLQEGQVFQEIKNTITKGQVKIKVERPARDFIKNGKTEAIEVDGNLFNLITDEFVQDYLGLQFYYFILDKTT